MPGMWPKSVSKVLHQHGMVGISTRQVTLNIELKDPPITICVAPVTVFLYALALVVSMIE
jgi:hypothetical protein